MEIITYDKAKEIWNKIAKSSENNSLYIELEVHKKLLDIFHVGPHYYYIFNLITVSVEFIDSKMTNVLGYSEEDFCTELFLSNIHPEDISYFLNFEHTVTEFFTKLPPEKVMKYKVSHDYRIRHADGHYVRILQQVTTIQSDETGAVIRTLGVHTDISNLKSEGIPKLSFIGLEGEPSYHDVKPDHVLLNEKSLLTKREKEILRLIIEGKSSDVIANYLHLSRHTVNAHRRNIYSKTKTNSIADLVKNAIHMGWV
jgi:DNA-binding CsgD family transcriptional regulator